MPKVLAPKKEKGAIQEIIKQVLYNPQVSYPPVSYVIADKSVLKEEGYSSEYIDMRDFVIYLKRLEEQLVRRLVIPLPKK